MTLLQKVGLAALLAFVFASAWTLRGCIQSEPTRSPLTAETDTTDAGRALAEEDTATTAASGASSSVANSSTPSELIRYETVTDTVRDCYASPASFDVQGLTTSRPLRVDPGGVFSSSSVTLTTFDPAASRFEQRVYDVPEPDWELWPDVGAEYGPSGLSADALLNLRRRHLHVWGGYRVAEVRLPTETKLLHGPTAGIRFRPFTLDW